MKKPAVELGPNLTELYQYYDERGPVEPATKIGHFVMNKFFRPRVSAAVATMEATETHLQSGGRIILAANHVSLLDSVVIAGVPDELPDLKAIKNKTFFAAKSDLFKNPLLRSVIESLGAIPVFKDRDTNNPDWYEQAKESFVKTCVTRMERGLHVAYFPEGSRGHDKAPTTVAPLKRGLGIIATRAAEAIDGGVIILPLGLAYEDIENRFNPKPYLHIEKPIHVAALSEQEVTEQAHAGIQTALHKAVSRIA